MFPVPPIVPFPAKNRFFVLPLKYAPIERVVVVQAISAIRVQHSHTKHKRSTSASQHAVESLAIQGGPKFGGSSERRKSSVIEPVNEKYLGSSAYTAFMNGRLHTRDGPRAPTTGTTEGVYDAHRPCHTHTAPYHMCRARQGLSLCVCENCQHGALGLDIVL